MNQAPPAELDTISRPRDANTVTVYEIHLTDIPEFVRRLVADFKAGIIEHNEVWFAIVAGKASEADVMRLKHPDSTQHLESFERREAPYQRRWVEASYFRHNRQVKVSHYCGVVLDQGLMTKLPGGRPLTEQCALAVQEHTRAILRAEDENKGLIVQTGAVYVADGRNWHQTPDLEIEAAPQERCASCDEIIYYANEQWRHKATKRAEALKPGVGFRGRDIKELDHLADPTEKGRLV
jgi:hypothetical protein